MLYPLNAPQWCVWRTEKRKKKKNMLVHIIERSDPLPVYFTKRAKVKLVPLRVKPALIRQDKTSWWLVSTTSCETNVNQRQYKTSWWLLSAPLRVKPALIRDNVSCWLLSVPLRLNSAFFRGKTSPSRETSVNQRQDKTSWWLLSAPHLVKPALIRGKTSWWLLSAPLRVKPALIRD